MDLREMRAFVAVVEEGGLSAAARRLHVSQPALSQTITTLERRLGVRLSAGTENVLRLGIPLELPSDLLTRPLAELAAAFPRTRINALHLSTSAQFAAFREGNLDAGLVREHPAGPELDAAPVAEERLGVLLAADRASALVRPDGVRLDELAGLDWVGFPRSGSPAWYDEIVAILRSHGVDPGPAAPEGQELIPEVKLAAVTSGRAFALAPPDWPQPLPADVRWAPLAGHPLIRRTWAVWPADSRRRDVARFVASLETRPRGRSGA
jgi:DNA-binding transcriptional LysR family regulator